MDLEKLLLDYARAWVMLHAPSVTGWSKEAVIDAFYLLPSPDIGFKEWCESRGYTIQDPIQPKHEEPTDGIEQGPGWAVATTDEGKAKIEAQLSKLERLAKRT